MKGKQKKGKKILHVHKNVLGGRKIEKRKRERDPHSYFTQKRALVKKEGGTKKEFLTELNSLSHFYSFSEQ